MPQQDTTEKQTQNNGRDERGRFTKGYPHAFKPGQSGNPKGRPKSITLSEAYRRQLAQVVPNDPDGRTFAEAIAKLVCIRAAQGDVTAAREIADRVEGKPRQAIDVDMQVSDWREIARRNGLDESEILIEARRLIESANDSSGDEST